MPTTDPTDPVTLVQAFRALRASATAEKWELADALERAATAEVMDDLIELVRDQRHGPARSVLIGALGRLGDFRVIDVLLELVDDPELGAQASDELRRRARDARPRLECLLHHRKARIRSAARRTLESWWPDEPSRAVHRPA
jgi:HEAT repeat protein